MFTRGLTRFANFIQRFQGGRSDDVEDFRQLIDVIRAREERLENDQFSHDATDRPNVHFLIVPLPIDEHFRGSPPTAREASQLLNEDLSITYRVAT